TGSAALIWGAFGGDRALVRAALENNADDLGTPGFDTCYGNGRVNPFRALTGAGQTDAGGTICPTSFTPTPTFTPTSTVCPVPVCTATPTDTNTATPTVTPTPGPPPPNDNLANAVDASALPFTDAELTTGATLQSGEATGFCALGGHTVWYSFTAAVSQIYELNTQGSN